MSIKVEITKDGPQFSEYTNKDKALDRVLDLINYAEEYKKTKWWQLIKQYLIVQKIGYASIGLVEIIKTLEAAK